MLLVYKLEKYWDDDLAKYHYRFLRMWSDGNGKIVATGNKEWAQRQAEHYNLTITEEE